MSKKQNSENCLYHSINALSRVITRIAEEEFNSVKLSPSAVFILCEVNSTSGISIGAVSKILQLSPSTLTRLVEGLEEKDLIKRIQKGKFTELHPTKKSKNLQGEILTCRRNFESKCDLLIGTKSRKKLVRKINDVTSSLT